MQKAGYLAARALTNELGRAFDGLASAAVDLLKELGGIASKSEEIQVQRHTARGSLPCSIRGRSCLKSCNP
jgi:hypothetical protein